MRVLYSVRDLEGRGGIQSFARNTNAGLEDESSVDIDMQTWHSPLSLPQELILRVVPGFVSKRLYPLWFHEDIQKQIEPYDIVHFWHIKSAMAVKSIGKPYVLTCHGSEIMRSIVPPYQFSKFMHALRDATYITTPSSFTKDYLVREYSLNAEKIIITHPGLDVAKFQVQGSEKETSIITVGTLTRLVKRKNVANVVRALEKLDKQGLQFRYRLAGTGYPWMRRGLIHRLKKAHFVSEYLGMISEEEKIHDFYPSLDVFVLPPLYRDGDVEGFGIVFLEANAAGVPVVAAKTGGVSDAVKEGVSGTFADPIDPADIACKILAVLKDKKNWHASTQKWAQNFELSRTSRQFLKIYQKILE
jgi:phosphatidylinositol alpha-1,6-mannosyltransferase